jgi:hypothetical protein
VPYAHRPFDSSALSTAASGRMVLCCVQDLRESRSGFLPGCDLEVQGVPFDNAETFYMDPVRPRYAMSRAGLA